MSFSSNICRLFWLIAFLAAYSRGNIQDTNSFGEISWEKGPDGETQVEFGNSLNILGNGALLQQQAMSAKWDKSYRRMTKKMEEQSPPERYRQRFRIRNPLVVNLLSEFFATTILLFVGTGIVAQHVLTDGKMNSWLHIHLGWNFGCPVCLWHLLYIRRAHESSGVTRYTFAAFVGSGLSYMVYTDEIQNYTGGIQAIAGEKATAGLFCSFPKPHISHSTAFVDQVVGTALYGLQPLFFGLGLFIVGCSYGMNLGNTINPARDFGPRVLPFSRDMAGKCSRGMATISGSQFYQLFIGFHINESSTLESNLAVVEINGLSAATCSELEPLSAEA
uniref:Aquaporin n=1 Tax=Ditylenchus dipsaci TaxID=166011 RepID=A0A915DVG5_9BILA